MRQRRLQAAVTSTCISVGRGGADGSSPASGEAVVVGGGVALTGGAVVDGLVSPGEPDELELGSTVGVEGSRPTSEAAAGATTAGERLTATTTLAATTVAADATAGTRARMCAAR